VLVVFTDHPIRPSSEVGRCYLHPDHKIVLFLTYSGRISEIPVSVKHPGESCSGGNSPFER
jgi:hypothetical protein